MTAAIPYGFWPSSLGVEALSSPPVNFLELAACKGSIFWTESRPLEKGRQALVSFHLDRGLEEVAPSMSVQSRIHEYGGGSFAIFSGTLIFFDAISSGLYLQKEGQEKICLVKDSKKRFADFSLSLDQKKLLAVCEEQTDNYLVQIDIDTGNCVMVENSYDFYASPRFSPDGSYVAFLSWGLSCMQWEECTLRVGQIKDNHFIEQYFIGKTKESICEFLWADKETLIYSSDRNGFWNLYRRTPSCDELLYPLAGDVGAPLWVLGRKHFALCLKEGKQALLIAYTQRAIDYLGLLFIEEKTFQEIPLAYTCIRTLDVEGSCAYFIGGGPQEALGIIQLDLTSFSTKKIATSFTLPPDFSSGISYAKEVVARSTHNKKVYGFYYPPKNALYQGKRKAPPLILKCHGGPTAHATTQLSLEVQFWTSRGFAFLEANYQGSSGFGRAYRDALLGEWGCYDVYDCLALVMELVVQGKACENALFVKGSSSGGFTALCLATSSLFKGCVSYYGVTDLVALSQETHKFEKNYLSSLIGDDPRQYEERSPIFLAQEIACPVLFFHGQEDRIVPLQQAENLANLLQDSELVVFPGEGHSFKQALTTKTCLEKELSFYQKQLEKEPDLLKPELVTKLSLMCKEWVFDLKKRFIS